MNDTRQRESTGINPAKLKKIHCPKSGGAPDAAYVDRESGVCVQVWKNAAKGCDGTPWQGTLRVAIKHSGGSTPDEVMSREFTKPITWDDMQAIKDHFWPERIAVEVFPPNDRIVNVADLRWMWVLPKGAVLPFNLQGGETTLTS